jgi:hypothetical protein
MTKKDEKKYYKEIKPFIEKELSFVITEDDKKKYSCGGENRVLIERDGYNYEISKHVLGQLNNELIEYRILRTIIPYKYNNYLICDDNIFTDSCWVHLKRRNGEMDINCYEKYKLKKNCCRLCKLCDKKTEWCKSFSNKTHNQTKKHINNVIMYNDTIKQTLEKKVHNDLVRGIMSFL